ncbi:MAG TPA: hypothetical protein VGL72_18645 [Bryobacteraceae bacterium]|jgi:hypothetical protein
MAIRTPPNLDTPDAGAVRQQLERILASPQICHSRRCQSLLKYVVEAYLEGATDRVKERIIGYEVFQRDPDYDTNQDSVVRTTAAEVRKRLAQYYLEPGHEKEIRIELPPGTYRPEFRVPEFRMPESPLQPEILPRNIHVVPARASARWTTPVALVVLAVAIAVWVYARFGKTDLDRFWAPLLGDRSDAVICIEQPLKIFAFTGPRTDDLNALMFGAGATPPSPQGARRDTSLKLAELAPAGDRYFTYGDLMAASQLSGFLARKGKTFQVLGDRLTNYRDLRGRPAILLGEFNNRWTVGLTSGLRYYFDKNLTTQTYELRDRQHQGQVLLSVPKSRRVEEYAIVSRIFGEDGHRGGRHDLLRNPCRRRLPDSLLLYGRCLQQRAAGLVSQERPGGDQSSIGGRNSGTAGSCDHLLLVNLRLPYAW